MVLLHLISSISNQLTNQPRQSSLWYSPSGLKACNSIRNTWALLANLLKILTGTEYGLPAFNGVRSSDSNEPDSASPADWIPRLPLPLLLFPPLLPFSPLLLLRPAVVITPPLRRHRTTPRNARKPIRPAAVTSANLYPENEENDTI